MLKVLHHLAGCKIALVSRVVDLDVFLGSDPDPVFLKGRIRIRVKLTRIRNPVIDMSHFVIQDFTELVTPPHTSDDASESSPLVSIKNVSRLLGHAVPDSSIIFYYVCFKT